ncbi:unnamed protein product, partial [marine sediment metagenome]
DKKVRAIMQEHNKGKEKENKISYEEAYEILQEREKKSEEGETNIKLSEKCQKVAFEEGCTFEDAYDLLKERGELTDEDLEK